MKKVSIIIPLFNNADKIRKCLNSLVRQTYEEIEVIVVDDGSVDNSYQIAESYAGKDQRIRVISKKNEGAERARSMGRAHATGNYLMFVDSDDWLPKNAVKKLVDALEKNKADISFGSYIKVLGNSAHIRSRIKSEIYQHRIITGREVIEDFLQNMQGEAGLPDMLWAKLYKRELFDEELEEVGVFFKDDTCLNLQIMPKAKKIVSIPDCVYYYRVGPFGGQTRNYHGTIFAQGIAQADFKAKYYRKYGRQDLIKNLHIEIVQFFKQDVEQTLQYFPEKVNALITERLENERLQLAAEALLSDSRLNVSESDAHYCQAIRDKNYNEIRKLQTVEIQNKRFKNNLIKFAAIVENFSLFR